MSGDRRSWTRGSVVHLGGEAVPRLAQREGHLGLDRLVAAREEAPPHAVDVGGDYPQLGGLGHRDGTLHLTA